MRPALTSLERELGWTALFDGRDLAGWRSTDGAPPGDGWRVHDGVLEQSGGAGDLLSTRVLRDVELRFAFRVAPGGNSGVKLRVLPAGRPGAGGAPLAAPVGLEFQILDDLAHPDAASPSHRCAALYDLVPRDGALDARLDLAGTWHAAGVRLDGGRLTHRLDGARVLRVQLDDAAFAERVAHSKFAGVPDFGRLAGPVLLQDHGDPIAFRDVVVRDLAALPGRPAAPPPFDAGVPPRDVGSPAFADVRPFDVVGAHTLAGDDLDWRALGDARWTLRDDEILGETDGGSQSFLVSRRAFGDAIVQLDVLVEGKGNSGIQVRSHVSDAGRMFGYQVEIDPSERAWSGGLYDEARRGWLDDLSDQPEARAAFRSGEWLRYRIELAGPSIRPFVDDVPCADVLDPLDLEGHLAFQVHAGQDTRVRWRGLRVRDLGTRAWEPLPVDAPPSSRDATGTRAWARDASSDARPSWTAAGRGTWALASDAPREDEALRVELRARGDVRLALLLRARSVADGLAAWDASDADAPRDPDARHADDAAPDAPTRLALPAGGRLLLLPRVADDAAHSLALCTYGARVAVHLDGRLLLDARVDDLAPSGACGWLARLGDDATLELARPERLGEPR
ncbi:MAG: DUF1080 domain-containing protein [Planctomycetes bacterium]|nr:DUF1080 domain-containing protein [Planctomycetota bacterium]